MFQLNRNHRQGLIEDLNRTIADIELKERCIQQTKNEQEKESSKADNSGLIGFWEMDLFLLEKKKELIEKALIDGEIDW